MPAKVRSVAFLRRLKRHEAQEEWCERLARQHFPNDKFELVSVRGVHPNSCVANFKRRDAPDIDIIGRIKFQPRTMGIEDAMIPGRGRKEAIDALYGVGCDTGVTVLAPYRVREGVVVVGDPTVLYSLQARTYTRIEDAQPVQRKGPCKLDDVLGLIGREF